MARFRSFVVVVAIVFVLGAFAGMAQAAISKGKPAPNFKLKGLDGKTYQLSNYKGKKAVVIDFWATWCGPCQQELPHVQSIWKKYEKRPVQFLGVNVDGRGDVQGTIRSMKLTFPNMIDTANVSQDYGVSGIPMLVVIDKRGIVREIMVGYDPQLERTLPALLDRYSK